MLFGTKEIFGIEIEINNFFHDKWIGEGKFIVHICGKPYGLDEPYATILYSIPNELYNFCQRLCNTDMELESFDGNEIAKYYYLQNYSETNLSDCDKDFLNKTKKLLEWSPEAAFDDGSHVIHFDDGDTTRIIGFKSCMVDGDCQVMENSCSEIHLPRENFKGIIKDAYLFLKSFSTSRKA